MSFSFKKIALSLSNIIGTGIIALHPKLITAQEAGDYELLAPLPIDGVSEGVVTSLPAYLSGLFGFAIGIAAVLAVVMIVLGGIQYMTDDAVSNKSEGKEKITAAVGGLILALASWLILNTINENIISSSSLVLDNDVSGTASEIAEIATGPHYLEYQHASYLLSEVVPRYILGYRNTPQSGEFQEEFPTLEGCGIRRLDLEAQGKIISTRCRSMLRLDENGGPLMLNRRYEKRELCIEQAERVVALKKPEVIKIYCELTPEESVFLETFETKDSCRNRSNELKQNTNRRSIIVTQCTPTTNLESQYE